MRRDTTTQKGIQAQTLEQRRQYNRSLRELTSPPFDLCSLGSQSVPLLLAAHTPNLPTRVSTSASSYGTTQLWPDGRAAPRPPDPLIHRCLRGRVSVPCLPPLRNWPSLARYWLLRLRQLFGLYGRECGDSSSLEASKNHCPNGLPHPGTDSCRNSRLAAIMRLR